MPLKTAMPRAGGHAHGFGVGMLAEFRQLAKTQRGKLIPCPRKAVGMAPDIPLLPLTSSSLSFPLLHRDSRPITTAAKQVEEHRRQEDAEERYSQHAAEGGNAERRVPCPRLCVGMLAE